MQLDPAAGPPPTLPEGANPADPALIGPMDPEAGDLVTPSRPADTGPHSRWVCPFLRAIDDDDVLVAPVQAPDPANRCAALREVVPQSLRQQELVCLTSGHVNCPRYLRGSMGAAEARTVARGVRTVTPATAGALVAFAAAFVLSVAFVVANGGLVLTAAATRSPGAADVAAGNSPASTASVTIGATVPPSAASSAAPTATPAVSATAAPAPLPTPRPTPSSGTTATPPASSDRYALLTACPDEPDCWIYVVRSGDNLSSIANYFGVKLQTVQTLNPWTSSTRLQAGQQLRLPPPTR